MLVPPERPARATLGTTTGATPAATLGISEGAGPGETWGGVALGVALALEAAQAGSWPGANRPRADVGHRAGDVELRNRCAPGGAARPAVFAANG